MKEEDINQLLKESRTTTSDHFTDKLMEKIEMESKVVRISAWHKLFLALGIAGLIGTSFFIADLLEVKLIVYQIDLPPFSFQGTAILFALCAFNFYLKLTERVVSPDENL